MINTNIRILYYLLLPHYPCVQLKDLQAVERFNDIWSEYERRGARVIDDKMMVHFLLKDLLDNG